MQRFLLNANPDQQFTATLNGQRCTFRFKYNPTSDRWAFDMTIGDRPALNGRRIVTGIDLLAPFGFGLGAMFALGVKDDFEVPDWTAFSSGRVALYHATATEIAAAEAA